MSHLNGSAPAKEASEETRTVMIRELLNAGEPTDRIAARVREVLTPEEAESILLVALKHEIQREIAASSRAVAAGRTQWHRGPLEGARAEFLAHAMTWKGEHEDPGERISRRADLLEMAFTIPGTGEIVKWGLATEAQHLTRKEYVEKGAVTLMETAHLHARAISEIQAAGVRTLNDIVELRHANERAIEAPVPA